jgi:hypothetical protein
MGISWGIGHMMQHFIFNHLIFYQLRCHSSHRTSNRLLLKERKKLQH